VQAGSAAGASGIGRGAAAVVATASSGEGPSGFRAPASSFTGPTSAPVQASSLPSHTPSVGVPAAVVAAPSLVLERVVGDGKVERRYSDGRRVVTFRNGTEKELAADGHSIVRFVNGDIKTVRALPVPHTLSRGGPLDWAPAMMWSPKSSHTSWFDSLCPYQTYPSTGDVVYYYAEAKTTHTTSLDGTETFQFPTGQVHADITCRTATACVVGCL
jgi:hypothetical protein